MKIPSDEELGELAAWVGDVLLSGLPQISDVHNVFFEVDLLTGKVTPEEVMTESLSNLLREASEMFFDDLESVFGIKKDGVKGGNNRNKGKGRRWL